jgi:tetratricopeptide (TPR) repeat protein
MVGGFLDQSGAREERDNAAMLEESVNVYRQLGDNRGVALAASLLAWALDRQSDVARVRELTEESISRARACGDDQILVHTLFFGGHYAGVLDDDRRQAVAEESLELARQGGNILGIAISHRILGDVALRRRQYDRARESFVEDLKGTRLLRETVGICIALQNLGDVSILLDKYPSASAYYDEARRLCDEIGWAQSDMKAEVLRRLGRLAALQGDLAQGEDLVRQALAINRTDPDRSDSARCLAVLADIARRQGKLERVARLLGAVQPLRGVGEAPWEPAEYERLAAAARDRLSDAAFAAAWDEGQAMTLDQAIAYALGEAND